MKNSKCNTYYVFWVNEHADTHNPIISANRLEWNIWPIFLVLGMGLMLVVPISIGTHPINTHSNCLVLILELIPP